MKFISMPTLLALVLSAASGFMLFSTAQKVQQADSELQRMKSTVMQEEQTIRVLRAEWDYLNRPDRLEALVKNNLELSPATAESVRRNTSELPGVYVPIVPARKPAFNADSRAPALQATPAVLQSESSPPQALPKPAAPQSPAQEIPRKDFQTLLNDLAPAGGDGQ